MASKQFSKLKSKFKRFGRNRCEEQQKPKKWSIVDLDLGEMLGKGGYGKVIEGTIVATGKKCAVKYVDLDKLGKKKERMKTLLKREIEIHSELRHDNIIHMIAHFKQENVMFMVLELAEGGDVFHFMRMQPHKRFDNLLAARFISQVSDALNYCHENNIIHRDIKPGNLLMDHVGDIKLADFGLSVKSVDRRTTHCGTTVYMAPEVFLKIPYDYHVDIWSVGIMCYTFLVGREPFRYKNKDVDTLLAEIGLRQLEYPDHVCEPAKDLIDKLLQLRPQNRIELVDVMQHPWVTYYDELDYQTRLKNHIIVEDY